VVPDKEVSSGVSLAETVKAAKLDEKWLKHIRQCVSELEMNEKRV
jgi:hypothetical protein